MAGNAEPDRSFLEQERPAGDEARELFGAMGRVLAQLDLIVEQIVDSALSERTDRAFTFLVSGDWGVGKSTALEYIESRVRDRAWERTVFAWYRAPLFEARAAGPRSSMLAELVQAMSHQWTEMKRKGIGTANTNPANFLAQALGVEDVDPSKVQPDKVDQVRALARRLKLSRKLGDESVAGMALEQWLPRFHETDEVARRQTTVILIDDLDRCSRPEFIRDVLVATQHWSQATNHYFVVAADEARVREALEEALPAAESAPDSGLGKYVHLTVRIPPEIPPDGDAARALFLRWITGNRFADRVRNELVQRAGTPDEVLDPLLRGCTPRVLKSRYNALVGWVGDATDLDGRQLHELVLEICWPERFERVRRGLSSADGVNAAWCRHLAELGRLVRADATVGHVGQVARVAELAEQSGIALEAADAEIALFIAHRVPGAAAVEVVPVHPVETRAAQHDRSEAHDDDLSDALDRLTRRVGTGERDLMRSAYREVFQQMTRLQRIPAQEAPPLNAAADAFARIGDYPTARQLHIWAVEADPRHPGAVLGLVSFVLDQQLQDQYEHSSALLRRLSTEQLTAQQRDRLLFFDVRLLLFRRQNVRPELNELVERAVQPGSAWQADDLRDVMDLAGRARHYDVLPVIAERLLDLQDGDVEGRARTLGLLTGLLRRSTLDQHREFAAELYRFLLRSGLIRTLDRADQADIVTGLAEILIARQVLAPAAYLIWHAYVLRPDEETKSLLANCYDLMGHADVAGTIRTPGGAVPVDAPGEPPFRQPLPLSPAAADLALSQLPAACWGEPFIPELWEQE